MIINIRPETAADRYAVECLTREAFWGFSRPDCDEHYLVHCLRSTPAFIPELDFVAEADSVLAGNVMYSKAKVVSESGLEHEVITFGPLSVLPQYQNRGVGSALMRHSILKARDMGYRGIVFYGYPDYYPRFGFQNAKIFGITTPASTNFDALMAMELYDGAMRSIHGKFYEDPVFDCCEQDARAYDANFPAKEPAKMIPIDVLLEKLPAPAQKAFTDRKITTLAWLNRFSGCEMLGWDGIDVEIICIINKVLIENGFCPKLLPGCEILEKAKSGIRILG